MSGSFLEEFAVGFTISLVWLTIHVLSTDRRGNTPDRLVAISTISSVVALYLLTSVPYESISSSLKSLIYFLALTPLAAAPFLLRITVSHSNEFDPIALQEADSVSDSE
jgi:multisubunit Na+/H+ antiporter MnhF subunit